MVKYIQLDINAIDADCIKLIPEPIVRKFTLLAHHQSDGILYIAAANPSDPAVLSALGVLNLPVVLGVAPAHELEAMIAIHYRQTNKVLHLAEQAKSIAAYETANLLNQTEYVAAEAESSIISMLDTILTDAMNLSATDIHIESTADNLIVRYRISGNLIKQLELNSALSKVLVRHVLARSDANLTEFRLPQDSSFRFDYRGQSINIRVSVLFGYEGSYSIVLRLLMSAEQYQHLSELVQDKTMLASLKQFLAGMNGMLIIAGPTSSGKTTLLYNALSSIADTHKKILTIEDPVEAMLPGMTQVQTQAEIGLDFAHVIRASLRQNPDVMMLGEMRDVESASMAMRAAITGVMVLSTLHTKNVMTTALRLLDLGIDLPIVASALKMIVSTRLVRILCNSCKQPYQPGDAELASVSQFVPANHESKVIKNTKAKYAYYKPVGCADCWDSGYRSVLGIYETLNLSDAMTSALASGDITQFKQLVATAIAGKEFIHQGVELWRSGQTSFEEVAKLNFNS